MKIVLLCSAEANQRALAHRLSAAVSLAAIAVCKPPARLEKGFVRKASRVARGVAGLPFRSAWFGMLADYDESYPRFPQDPALTVEDVNDPRVFSLIENIRPGLVIVSGTNLLKQPLIDAIAVSGKVMNLHTGISPYVRGGPNCTNWCLATGRFDLIGNTVMWIDAGIDSGNLIATEKTPFDGSENLGELHRKVMDHAHDLLVRCVKLYVAGTGLPNVRQGDLGRGQLFLSRQWNAAAAARAVANFYLRFGKQRPKAGADIKLVTPGADQPPRP